MDNRVAIPFAELSGNDVALTQLTLNHLSPQLPYAVHLHLGSIIRYDYRRLHTEKLCGKSHALSMVA